MGYRKKIYKGKKPVTAINILTIKSA